LENVVKQLWGKKKKE